MRGWRAVGPAVLLLAGCATPQAPSVVGRTAAGPNEAVIECAPGRQGEPMRCRGTDPATNLIASVLSGEMAEPGSMEAALRRATVVTRPIWITPPGGDLRRHYPERARAAGVGGEAVAICETRSNGRMATCRVQSETPAGYGFGEATVRMARGARIGPRDRDGEDTDARPVEIRMTWVPPGS